MRNHGPALTCMSLALSASLAMAQSTPPPARPVLEEVGRSDSLFNVVTVSRDGRIFASFPRLSPAQTPVVGEVMRDGSVRPFPGGVWNGWTPGMPTAGSFVHAHTVQIDRDNNLWVVDQGNEAFGMPSLPGGPRLVRVDLATNQVAHVYTFDTAVLPAAASLNDVQVRDGFAYIADHGLASIVVLDLNTGVARRVLGNSPSTRSNPAIVPVVEGRPMRGPDGQVPQIHVNPVAMSPGGVWLYYQATWGPDVMRVRTADLRNTELTEDQLAHRVENAGRSVPTGGMAMDDRGILFLSDMERSAITLRCPNRELIPLCRMRDYDSPMAAASDQMATITSRRRRSIVWPASTAATMARCGRSASSVSTCGTIPAPAGCRHRWRGAGVPPRLFVGAFQPARH